MVVETRTLERTPDHLVGKILLRVLVLFFVVAAFQVVLGEPVAGMDLPRFLVAVVAGPCRLSSP